MDVDKIYLEMTAVIKDERLLVSYALANRSAQTLVAFDGAKGTGGDEYPDLTAQCYVSFVPPATARILRTRPPAHPTLETAHTFIPAASQILAGQTRNVKFSLPLPLKERSYFSPDFDGAIYAVQPVGEVELRIGCFWKTPETKLIERAAGVFIVQRGAPLTQIFEVACRFPLTFNMSIRKDAEFIRM